MHREELFYQLGVRQFGDFSRIKLEPPPMIRDLIKLAVDADETTNEIRLSKEEITNVSFGRATQDLSPILDAENHLNSARQA